MTPYDSMCAIMHTRARCHQLPCTKAYFPAKTHARLARTQCCTMQYRDR